MASSNCTPLCLVVLAMRIIAAVLLSSTYASATGTVLPSALDVAAEQDLRALYDATGGDAWSRNDGWREAFASAVPLDGNRSKTHWCSWYGIACRSDSSSTTCWKSAHRGGGGGCVITTIDLSANNLRGVLPLDALCREGGAFAAVRVLNLSHNALVGGSVVFHVSQQSPDGVPLLHDAASTCAAESDASMVASLAVLDVSFNRLNASLRWFLHRSRGGVRMPNLRVLLARGNRLRDVILDSHPPMLSDSSTSASALLFPSLEVFDIGLNCILGQFPSATFAFHTPRLHVLKLDNNFLVDSTLSWLHVGSGRARDGASTGSSLGQRWSATLTVLHLQNNYIQSTIPASISTFVNLKEVVLDGNRIYGTIPQEFQALRHLQSLSLAHNYLRGSVPCQGWFTAHSPFASLLLVDLTDNELDGTVCEVAPDHPLQVLRLADNALSGALPAIRGRALAEVTLGGENRWACELPAASAIPNWMDPAPSTKCVVAAASGGQGGLSGGSISGDANAASSTAAGSWWRVGLFGGGRRAAAAARHARIQEEGAEPLGVGALHAFSAFLVMVVVVPISLAVVTAAGVHLPASECMAPRRFLQWIHYEPTSDDDEAPESNSESETDDVEIAAGGVGDDVHDDDGGREGTV